MEHCRSPDGVTSVSVRLYYTMLSRVYLSVSQAFLYRIGLHVYQSHRPTQLMPVMRGYILISGVCDFVCVCDCVCVCVCVCVRTCVCALIERNDGLSYRNQTWYFDSRSASKRSKGQRSRSHGYPVRQPSRSHGQGLMRWLLEPLCSTATCPTTGCSKKTDPQVCFDDNFGKCGPILTTFSLSQQEIYEAQKLCYISHLTFIMLPLYLAKQTLILVRVCFNEVNGPQSDVNSN